MDRLRSPGGCPWDAAQTHASLARYTIEEAHEVVEAIESGDPSELRAELGDLLLQVVFHARISQDSPTGGFTLDDVAHAVADKLIRRHPHVFPTAAAPGPAASGGAAVVDQATSWEQIKRAEDARTSVADGLPPGLPPLAALTVLHDRARAAGLDVSCDPHDDAVLAGHLRDLADGVDIAARERAALRRYRELIAAAEAVSR